jgi:hypothetical protein
MVLHFCEVEFLNLKKKGFKDETSRPSGSFLFLGLSMDRDERKAQIKITNSRNFYCLESLLFGAIGISRLLSPSGSPA